MTLQLITDWPKHFRYMTELRERCAAELLNRMATDPKIHGGELVRSVEAKMIEEGWEST